uniref:PDZ domain-containing protein n=1 Tax=Romanomermis culicivorax TaxID=13658 RepID=A0A915IDV2_ROMCU
MPFSPVSKKVSDFSLNSATIAQSDSSTADSIRRQSLTPDFRAFSDHEKTSSINFRSTTSFSDYGLFYEGDQDSSTSCTTASSSCSNFLLPKVLVAAQSDDNELNKFYANKAASQPYNGQSIDSLTYSDEAIERNTTTFTKLRRSSFFGLGTVNFELEQEKKEEVEEAEEGQNDQFSNNRRFLSYLGSTESKTHLTAVCSSDRRRSSMPEFQILDFKSQFPFLAIGTPATIMANLGDHKAQKCVIVAKEDNGFGLTIGGDNPFFVQSVKLGSSADRVGVKSGDRILKISGNMLVGLNHMDVVKMIGNCDDTQHAENENAQSTVLARPLIRHSIAQMLHQQSTESITVPAYIRSVKPVQPVIHEQEYVEKNKEHDKQQKEHIKRLKDALLEEKRIYEELTTIPGALKLIKNRRTLEQCKKRIASLRQQLAELNASSPLSHLAFF